MADETQTQDTTEGGLAALPSGKGINIAGQKGVNLGAEQSSAIRDRLMQMIAEREGYNSSWQRIGDLGALAAAPIGGYSAAYDQYAARGRQRLVEAAAHHRGGAHAVAEAGQVDLLHHLLEDIGECFGHL